MPLAMGMYSVVLGLRPRGGVAAQGGSKEEEMADVGEEKETGEARDGMLTETKIAAKTHVYTDEQALTTNNYRDPAQLCKVIRVDQCRAGDRSHTQGGRSLPARVMERTTRYWDQSFGIQNKQKKQSMDCETER